MSTRLVMLCCLVSAGCVEEVSNPAASSVSISVQNPLMMGIQRPLRYALVWTGTGMRVSADGPLDRDAQSQAIPLVLLPEGWESLAIPTEAVAISTHTDLSIYRPRLIVYEDVDSSGTFEPGGTLGSGPDRVLAIDSENGTSVAAVLYLDLTLQRLSLEESEAFYQMTGGIYTPFVLINSSGSNLQLTTPAETPAVQLRMTDSPVPVEQLRCGHNRVWISGDGSAVTREITAVVAYGLDATDICGAEMPDCKTEVLADMEEPVLWSVRTDAFARIVQCRTNGAIEALLVQEATRICNNCVCTMTPASTIYFSDAANLPAWWPCGGSVPFCDSNLPMYFLDANCLKG